MSAVAIETIRRWRVRPIDFVREVFRAEPDDWQAQMLLDYAQVDAHGNHDPSKKNRTAACACKGPGKTCGECWCGWHFLVCYPEAKVPCTSVTGDNLRDGLWAEFAKWQQRSELLKRAFTWTAERIFQNERPETWWASARRWSKDADPSQQANTLAGLHADHILFIIDEVSDIPDGVVAAAEGALTSGKTMRLLMAGNPTRTEGPLYRAFTTDSDLFNLIRITGDPDNPARSKRIDIEEARRQIQKYGRDSLTVKVNILGEFPDRQADKLLDVSDVQAAQTRTLPDAAWVDAPRIIGVDVARFGDDASVFAPRQGRVVHALKEFRGLDTVQLAEELISAITTWDADMAFIDEGGVGAGVLDTCRARGFGHKVQGINFGMRARDDERFENRRTEMYWTAAEWVKAGGCLPRGDFLLQGELCAPSYRFDKKSRVCLERSEDVKARLGRSPDRASAFVLTFAGPVLGRRQQAMQLPAGAAAGKCAGAGYHPFQRSA